MSFQESVKQLGVATAIAQLCEFYCNKTFAVIDGEIAIYGKDAMVLRISGGEILYAEYDSTMESVSIEKIDSILEVACWVARWLDTNQEDDLSNLWYALRVMERTEDLQD